MTKGTTTSSKKEWEEPTPIKFFIDKNGKKHYNPSLHEGNDKRSVISDTSSSSGERSQLPLTNTECKDCKSGKHTPWSNYHDKDFAKEIELHEANTKRNYKHIWSKAIEKAYIGLAELGEDMSILSDRDKHVIDCVALAMYRIMEEEN